MKCYHFWHKNDGEKWSRKNIFEIPPCACHFLSNEFTSWRFEDPIFIDGFGLDYQVQLGGGAVVLPNIYGGGPEHDGKQCRKSTSFMAKKGLVSF